MSKLLSILFTAFLLLSVVKTADSSTNMPQKMDKKISSTATFGGGCFWCTEAIFKQLKGVTKVTSGYSGGEKDNPTYKEVCSGNTGHAECIQIEYDPDQIGFDKLLEVFWMTHDPTTLNQQGADVGTQYRSVIFYHDDEQRELATSFKAKLTNEKIWAKPIVTEITKFEKFYPAEKYHQDYYFNNKNQGYCQIVITPKVEKFKKIFHDDIKN